MSKQIALGLALDFYRGVEPQVAPDVVLTTAGMFAAFIGEETPAKPARAARAAKTPEAPPVIVDPQPEPVEPKPVIVETVVEVVQEKVPAAVQAEAAKITEADVKAAVGKLAVNAAAGGAPKAREILGSCGGATNISTLKPEFYAKALKAINAALESAAVAA